MKKKRRTELDIDPTTIVENEAEAEVEASPTEAAPPAPKEAVESTPGKKINYTKLLMLIAAGIALVAVTSAIGFGVVSIVKSLTSEAPKKEAIKPAPPPAPKLDTPTPSPPVATQTVTEPIYQLKPFFVPIGKKGEESFVRIEFAAEMTGPEVKKEIERNLVLIRENIFFMLKNLSVEDFTNEKKREKVAVEAAIALNRSIQSGAVNKMLITALTIE